MAKRPSAKWTGVLDFPELHLAIDGGLYGALRRGRTPLPLVQIHTACQTRLPSAPPEEQAEPGEDTPGPAEEQAPTSAQTTRAVHCPSCQRALRTDEIGRAVDTQLGLLRLTDEEASALKPQRKKRVTLRLVQDVAEVLATVGVGRRFYFLPKAESVRDYYRLLAILGRANRVGFAEGLVVDRREYVVVVQPIATHAAVFGRSRNLLVVDEFVDTDLVRDPDEFQLLPAQEPTVPTEEIASALAVALAVTDTVDPGACVNPERRRFRDLVARKLAAHRVL